MIRIVAVALVAGGTMALAAPAQAGTDGTGGTPPRACLQLAAAPEAPLRPSGREVRIVTYTVVRTLDVADAVSYPAFFVYPHQRANACELVARSGRAVAPPLRGRGDARRR